MTELRILNENNKKKGGKHENLPFGKILYKYWSRIPFNKKSVFDLFFFNSQRETFVNECLLKHYLLINNLIYCFVD